MQLLQRNVWSDSKTFFERVSEHLVMTPFTGKFFRMSKKSTIFDHMLLDDHIASFDNFSIN